MHLQRDQDKTTALGRTNTDTVWYAEKTSLQVALQQRRYEYDAFFPSLANPAADCIASWIPKLEFKLQSSMTAAGSLVAAVVLKS
jgi:hypothetical protein